MTPNTPGEFHEYTPSLTEARIGTGINSVGFMMFTILSKITTPIIQGTHNDPAGGEKARKPVSRVDT